MNFRRPLKQNWGEKTDRVHWNKGKNFMLTYRLHTEFDNQMLREYSYSPICWHGWPLPHEWLGKEQPPHCQPGPLSAWDSFLQGIQHKDMIKMYQEKKKETLCGLRFWNSTCGSVRCICITSSLDKLCCKAVLIKWGSIHYWNIILKWVYWGIRGHSDVLQGQPKSSAALVVFQFQV